MGNSHGKFKSLFHTSKSSGTDTGPSENSHLYAVSPPPSLESICGLSPRSYLTLVSSSLSLAVPQTTTKHACSEQRWTVSPNSVGVTEAQLVVLLLFSLGSLTTLSQITRAKAFKMGTLMSSTLAGTTKRLRHLSHLATCYFHGAT